MFGPRYSIEIVNGCARVRRGSPPHGFVSACEDIAGLYGIEHGRIECIGRGTRARLRFSASIPQRAHQPLRNAWTPPSTPGKGGSRARG